MPPIPPIPSHLVDYIERLHGVVDDLTGRLRARHGERLRCRLGCSGCCMDELTVFEVEAAVIERHHAALLREGQPAPEGACAFLDEKDGCRIYAHRPYVCRTQGLPLRWIEEEVLPSGEPEIFESRDICPLNLETGPPLEELSREDCWDLGPFEARLRAAQLQADGGEGQRVPLRSLFEHQS